MRKAEKDKKKRMKEVYIIIYMPIYYYIILYTSPLPHTHTQRHKTGHWLLPTICSVPPENVN